MRNSKVGRMVEGVVRLHPRPRSFHFRKGTQKKNQNQEKVTMALGKYVPQAQIEYDRRKVTDMVGVPMLVKVREIREGFTSPAYPEPKDVVIVDVVDLRNFEVLIGLLWGAVAVVDNLRDSAGRDIILPVMPVSVRGANGRDYVTLAALEGQNQELAEAFYAKYPNALDEERNRRLAKAKPMGELPKEAPTAPQGIQGMSPAQPATPAAQPAAQEAGPFDSAQPSQSDTDSDVAAALARLNAS